MCFSLTCKNFTSLHLSSLCNHSFGFHFIRLAKTAYFPCSRTWRHWFRSYLHHSMNCLHCKVWNRISKRHTTPETPTKHFTQDCKSSLTVFYILFVQFYLFVAMDVVALLLSIIHNDRFAIFQQFSFFFVQQISQIL